MHVCAGIQQPLGKCSSEGAIAIFLSRIGRSRAMYFAPLKRDATRGGASCVSPLSVAFFAFRRWGPSLRCLPTKHQLAAPRVLAAFSMTPLHECSGFRAVGRTCGPPTMPFILSMPDARQISLSQPLLIGRWLEATRTAKPVSCFASRWSPIPLMWMLWCTGMD